MCRGGACCGAELAVGQSRGAAGGRAGRGIAASGGADEGRGSGVRSSGWGRAGERPAAMREGEQRWPRGAGDGRGSGGRGAHAARGRGMQTGDVAEEESGGTGQPLPLEEARGRGGQWMGGVAAASGSSEWRRLGSGDAVRSDGGAWVRVMRCGATAAKGSMQIGGGGRGC
uniref:Uncharacterized protein n=1 Tax=Brachypodium distachyon TaxID=15368 RepID=A0A341N138_BRADI